MNNFKVSAFVNETETGIERVKREVYAFILESTWLEYHSSRNCELMQVGGLLDSKGYGIGLPRDSKIKDLLSDMILKLQDEQFLVERKDHWWKKTSHVKCTSADDRAKDANQLTVPNVGGIFLVLVVGLAISMIVAFLEYCWYARKVHMIPEGTIWKMMCKEFCVATKCLTSNRQRRPSDRTVTHPSDKIARANWRSASMLHAVHYPHYRDYDRYDVRDGRTRGMRKSRSQGAIGTRTRKHGVAKLNSSGVPLAEPRMIVPTRPHDRYYVDNIANLPISQFGI